MPKFVKGTIPWNKGLKPEAGCHPGRPHYAKGLCAACYRQQPTQRNRQLPRFKIYHKSPAGVASRLRSSQTERRKKWTIEYRKSEKYKAFRKKYRQSEKGKASHNACEHKRRALLNNLKGSYTSQEWLDLKTRYDNRCLCCGKHESELTKPLQQDHIVPISRGGTNYISNIQPLCAFCNLTKRAKTIDHRRVIFVT